MTAPSVAIDCRRRARRLGPATAQRLSPATHRDHQPSDCAPPHRSPHPVLQETPPSARASVAERSQIPAPWPQDTRDGRERGSLVSCRTGHGRSEIRLRRPTIDELRAGTRSHDDRGSVQCPEQRHPSGIGQPWTVDCRGDIVGNKTLTSHAHDGREGAWTVRWDCTRGSPDSQAQAGCGGA